MRRAICLLVACLPLACDALLGADFDDLHPPGAGAGPATSGGAAGAPPEGGSGQGGLGGALPLACGDMSGLQADAPWPMEGYCPTRQGRSPALGFTKPRVRWAAQLPAQIHSEPIVAADGTVFVITADVLMMTSPRLHAVRDGVAVWFRDVSALATPALGADGTIYVADADTLRALDEDGNPRWTHAAGATLIGSPVIGADGTIYLSTAAGVRAVTAAGAEAWTADITQPSTAVAIGLDGTLYVGTAAGTFHALNDQGDPTWSFPTGVFTRDTPVVGGADVVYFKSDKRVHAVDAAGREKWSFSTGAWATVAPSAFGEQLFAVAIEGDNSYTLWSLDAQGQPDWSIGPLGAIGRFALSADGLLMSFAAYRPGVFDPEVVARRSDGGEVAWNVTTEYGSVQAFPSIAFGADGVVYAGVRDELLAIEAE